MENHRNLRRILRRAGEEARATLAIARATSPGGGAITLLGKLWIQRLNRTGWQETPATRKLLANKHAVMLCYFEKTMPLPAPGIRPSEPGEPGPIWLCWWQGEDKAPEIVRACIASVRRNAGSRKVILLTAENYLEYVSIPEWAVEKFRRGVISPTHFSDILRLSLLAEYGGIWLDASMYCTGAPEVWSRPLWTIKRPDYAHCSPASGNFATYAMGGSEENRWIFGLFREYLLAYWRSNNLLVDYLLLDYLMVLAQKNCPGVASAFRGVPDNQPCCDELCKVLGEPVDKEIWENMRAATCLFKLTWKQSFPLKKDGKPTFYAMLREGKL